ncbi:MAG: hypothetical protein OHK0046_16450 [Anaerolineae bacterium]
MPKYKERERQRREEEILKVAANLINQRGYAELNMDHIAEQVGVSKPTLYQHFKSKDELVIGVMRQSSLAMEAHMAEVEALSPLAQLETILRYLLMSHVDAEAFPATLVIKDSFHTLDSFRDVLDDLDRIGNRIFALVIEGQQRGEITEDISPSLIASSLFAVLGLLRTPNELESAIPDGLELSTPDEARVEEIVQFYIRGIKAQ